MGKTLNQQEIDQVSGGEFVKNAPPEEQYASYVKRCRLRGLNRAQAARELALQFRISREEAGEIVDKNWQE